MCKYYNWGNFHIIKGLWCDLYVFYIGGILDHYPINKKYDDDDKLFNFVAEYNINLEENIYCLAP